MMLKLECGGKELVKKLQRCNGSNCFDVSLYVNKMNML